MLIKKKSKINYLAMDIESSRGSGLFYLKWLAVMVESANTKRYHNTTALLIQLSKCSRALLDFIIERMDDNNNVNNNSLLKLDFNKIVSKAGHKPYGSVTVNKAFVELAEHHLLNTTRTKGTYQVNPLYFYNGSEEKRKSLIRKNLEKPVAGAARNRRKENLKRIEEKKE